MKTKPYSHQIGNDMLSYSYVSKVPKWQKSVLAISVLLMAGGYVALKTFAVYA